MSEEYCPHCNSELTLDLETDEYSCEKCGFNTEIDGIDQDIKNLRWSINNIADAFIGSEVRIVLDGVCNILDALEKRTAFKK